MGSKAQCYANLFIEATTSYMFIGLVNTSRNREKRGKTHETSTVNFGVKNK